MAYNENCSVCISNNYLNAIIVRYLSCPHWNCLSCYMKLLPNICPICRSSITNVSYIGRNQIFIKDLNNRTACLNVHLDSTTVDEIIYMITHKWNLICGVRLIFSGTYMFDRDKTLAEYKIKEYTLHIVASCYAKLPNKIESGPFQTSYLH
jgi:hypothetical protein